MSRELVEVPRATLVFHKYEEDGLTYYEFNATQCQPPEPMVNAMVGLQNLKDNEKLVMVNHKAPMGLFPKIENDFDFEVEELDGVFKITFSKKGDGNSTNFNDTACSGGGACAH